MRLLTAGLALAFALGCGGLLGGPEITSLVVTPDECGNWTATMHASGSGETLVLELDGATVFSAPVNGTQTLTAKGQAIPGHTVSFDARIETSGQSVSVGMPAVDAALVLSPPDGVFAIGAPATVDALFSSTCALGNPIVRMSLVDPSLPGSVAVWTGPDLAVGGPAGAHIVVPAQDRGLYELQVDAVSGDVPLASGTARVYWGSAEDDLDRDGYDGGLQGLDCDDRDPAVNPGVAENPLANRKDDDCDGLVDEGTTAYDDDGDGLSEDAGDCDDVDRTAFPGARELPDCRDQDCDGTVDEGVTLIQSDDSYEPNDTRAAALDLQTSRKRSFSQELTSVTRDAPDEEWFEFFSQDGDFDSWGIDVVAVGVPEGSTYDVEVFGTASTPLRAMRVTGKDHGRIEIRGMPFTDDSGDYLLRVKPVEVGRPWCPITLSLTSY